MREETMMQTRHVLVLCATGLLGLALAAAPLTARAAPDLPRVINLYEAGPQPQRLDIRAGEAVLWISHLTSGKLMVVTLAFLDGARVAEATAPVEGYNTFLLEGEHFVGRMEGNGGKVALRFTTPGTYTYTLGHEPHKTGTIVVAK
jgi:plastocyanin